MIFGKIFVMRIVDGWIGVNFKLKQPPYYRFKNIPSRLVNLLAISN